MKKPSFSLPWKSATNTAPGSSPSQLRDADAPVLPFVEPGHGPPAVAVGGDGARSTATTTRNTSTSTPSNSEKPGIIPAPPEHISPARPAAAPPHLNTQAEGEKSTALTAGVEGAENGNNAGPKPPLLQRAKAGCFRFGVHTKNALLHSWINVLLVFVPIGIAVNFAHLSPAIIFAMNAVAIIPLAGLLAHATESVASRLGDTLGALLNVSFGNAVELIIFMYVCLLEANEIRIVQASLLGSILANLLLILGMAFVAGGLRYQEQIYNNTVTQMSAVMLSLSVMSLLLPTAFHASFSQTENADRTTIKVSRGTSVVLLLVYVLYLVFQLKSHAYLYASMPQEIIDEESHPGVLHDVFDTSSSSSSSSSDSSDTDTSSGSHTTAKRIKRFIRKRRKSSASSDTASPPSQISSPYADAASSPGYFDDEPRLSRRPSAALPDILSGDEGDTDLSAHRVRAHDFGSTAASSSHSPDRKPKKKHRKRHRKFRRSTKSKNASKVDVVSEKTPVGAEPAIALNAPTQQPARVGFSDITSTHEGMILNRDGTPMSKKGLAKTFARPVLPKLLSQNVFVDPPPNQVTPQGHTKSASGSGIRRTSSLPDRLNERSRSTPGARALPSIRQPTGGTLAPYAARGAWAARAKPDTLPPSATDADEKAPDMSRTAAVAMLLITTGLVALCAEFLVDAIPNMTAHSSVSQAFIGLIILPIVGNAAEHVTAVTVAAKNKMDLAIGVAVGSSIQIALFITPVVVLLGWCMGKAMTLYFNLFETVSLFVTAFVVNFLVLDGKSNYLEGVLLIAAYIIIAVAAFFYPDGDDASALGGSDTAGAVVHSVASMVGL